MPITVNNFFSVAKQPQNENKTITVKDGQASVAGGFISPSAAANREAISAFVQALRAEYGDQIADMISSGILKDHQALGKSLTSRMVLDLTRLAAEEQFRVKEHNASVVKQFLNGQDQAGKPQGRNLEAAIGALGENKNIPPGFQERIKDYVKTFLHDKAKQGGFQPTVLSLESLLKNVGEGFSKYSGIARNLAFAAGSEGESFPGSREDKFRLVSLGILDDENSTFQQVAWELGKMRTLQPEGDLNPETVWKAVFNEDLPPEIARGEKPLAEALKKRGEERIDALALKTSTEPETQNKCISIALKYMSWGAAEALFLKQGLAPVTLGTMPGVATLFGRATSPGRLEKATTELFGDHHRAGGEKPKNLPANVGWPPPSFTFNRPDGRTETVQVGPRTNFSFADEKDEQAYHKGLDNSLSRRLIACGHEICGPGASEKQLASTLLCLSQAALLPLRTVSQIAGAGLDEHANVSVSLSQGQGGTVRVDFTSAKEAGAALGRFQMSLSIGRDGQVEVLAFELIPPKLIQREEALARSAREEDARLKLQTLPYLDIDQGNPEGLLAAMRQRAQKLSPAATISPQSLIGIIKAVTAHISKTAAKSDHNLSPEEIRASRDQALDDYFRELVALADHPAIPGSQRENLIRTCLENGLVNLKKELAPAIANMTVMVRETVGALPGAPGGLAAQKYMRDLDAMMNIETWQNEDLRSLGLGADDFFPARDLAMSLGIQDYLRTSPGNQESLILGLTRPGSPYRDAIHALAHEDERRLPEERLVARNQAISTGRWIAMAMKSLVPPETLDLLNPDPNQTNSNIPLERELSLARQREILGKDIVTRGAGVAVPALNVLNKSLPQDMARLTNHLRTEAENELINGPEGKRDGNGLSEPFWRDYPRSGIYVDGKYYHPTMTGTSLTGFKALFPDPYAAEKLSNLAAQNLPGVFLSSMYDPQLNSQAENPMVMGHTLSNPRLLRVENCEQNMRIDTLSADKGLYRVSFYKEMFSENDTSGVERIMFEVSVEVNLGPPGADPRPTPKVENAKIDFLVRGREAVPGETTA